MQPKGLKGGIFAPLNPLGRKKKIKTFKAKRFFCPSILGRRGAFFSVGHVWEKEVGFYAPQPPFPVSPFRFTGWKSLPAPNSPPKNKSEICHRVGKKP